ncbi:hypothetical protein ABIB39_002534 [Mucilaginibacter sp. UYP27]
MHHLKLIPLSGSIFLLGGEKRLTAYLKKNTRKLIDDHTHGRVIVTFVFERDETLTDVKVVRTYLRIQIPKLYV